MSLGCSMQLLRGYRAVPITTAVDCRRQHLAASSFETCAAACLAQPFCEAATWFNPDVVQPDSRSNLRGICVGRTAGNPSDFIPDLAADVAIRFCEVQGCGLQAQLDAYCLAASQKLPLGSKCKGSSVARNRRVLGRHDARLEDYEWVCAPPPEAGSVLGGGGNASMVLACVDDRGSMAPCQAPRDEKQPSLDCKPHGGSGALHDLQRRGCVPPACLATPGSGRPFSAGSQASTKAAPTLLPFPPSPAPLISPLPHWVRRGGGHGHTAISRSNGRRLSSELDYAKPKGATAFASAFAKVWRPLASSTTNAPSPSVSATASVGSRGTPPSPRRVRVASPKVINVHEANVATDRGNDALSEPIVNRLRRLGYLNCSMQYDELKDGCMAMRPDLDWLQYAWMSQRGATVPKPSDNGSGETHSPSAQAVSWWLKNGLGEDAFDAERFLRGLARLSSRRADAAKVPRESTGPLGFGDDSNKEVEVLFAGDSTARQQAVSLCCLLRAGSAVANSAFHVVVTKAVPFMDFKCRVYHASSRRSLASVSFQRIMRADSLPTWRPVERTPRLSPVLASAIARAPTMLIINLGAWEYEDGCTDMHSTHDALCNNTRPWILKEYASKWMLIAAALRATYHREKSGAPQAARSMVVWRAATPRDFEGGVAKQGGRCRRRQPLGRAELAAAERHLNPASMRFAVLTKNVIMDAVAAQAVPWVRVLDAYSIARQRADAHPGPDPKTNRGGSLHPRAFDDCLHYCLPGMPDLYNGRLLRLLEATVDASPPPSAAASSGGSVKVLPLVEGVPGTLLARWNFDVGGRRFVQGISQNFKVQVYPEPAAAPTPLECPLPAVRANEAGTGPTEPLLGFCSDFDHGWTGLHRKNRARGNGGNGTALKGFRRVKAPDGVSDRVVANGEGLGTPSRHRSSALTSG